MMKKFEQDECLLMAICRGYLRTDEGRDEKDTSVFEA